MKRLKTQGMKQPLFLAALLLQALLEGLSWLPALPIELGRLFLFFISKFFEAKTDTTMDQYTPEEILKKLEKTFDHEGVRLVSFHLDDSSKRVYVNLERFAPGLPTAFLVKGLQGTFRRYWDRQTEVILEHYQVLPEASETISHSSEQLKQDLLKGASHTPALAFKGIPCLDMRGASAKEAVSCLEVFINMVTRQSLKFCQLYLDNQNSRRVVRQWAAINDAKLSCLSEKEELWRLQFAQSSEKELDKQPEFSKQEVLPYRVLLLGSDR